MFSLVFVPFHLSDELPNMAHFELDLFSSRFLKKKSPIWVILSFLLDSYFLNQNEIFLSISEKNAS